MMRLPLWRCQQRQPHHVASLCFFAGSIEALRQPPSRSVGPFVRPCIGPAGVASQMPSGPPHRLTFRAGHFRQTLPHFRHYAVRQPVRCDLWSTLTSPPTSFVPIPYDWPCSRKVRLGLLLVFASVLFLRVLCLLGALSSAGSRGVICSSYSLKRCATLSRSA